MEVKGRDTQENRIRFKNLVRKVEKELQQQGLFNREMRDVVEAVAALEHNDDIWQHQGRGLALFFASQGYFHALQLPHAVPNHASIGQRFHLKPLFRYLNDAKYFYILVLGKNHSALYRATKHEIDEVAVPHLPPSFREYMLKNAVEETAQRHGDREDRSTVPQTQFVERNREKEELKEYIRSVDSSMHEVLATERVPLVLAAVEYYHPLFTEVTKYGNVQPHIIGGGEAEELAPNQLLEQALPYLKEYLDHLPRALMEVRRLIATEPAKVVSALEDIVFHAADGRIEILFLPEDDQQSGAVDWQQRSVQRVEAPGAEVDELTSMAGEKALETGATVYVLPKQELPGGQLTAILRY
jgi:hypothetical protein